jgi:phage terminase large subunit-like protein
MLYEWPEAMLEAQAYLEAREFLRHQPEPRPIGDEAWIAGELKKAAAARKMDGDTGSMQILLAKHLNVEIGLRLRRDRWRGADYWEGAGDPTLTLERCWSGARSR